MRVAFHTVLWGRQITDFDHVLSVIHRAGFQGIEIAQPVSQLGLQGRDLPGLAKELHGKLSTKGITLVGLAGGDLADRARFVDEYCKYTSGDKVLPPYLYTDTNPPAEREPVLKGKRIALHTMHPGRMARWQDARPVLDANPELLWLPDTAHLTISRSNLHEALTTFPLHRLAAVHFKDWTSEYGRFSHRYARGFIELGKGQVDLESAVRWLEEIKFNGWIVVELDYTRTTVEESAYECALWLSRHQLGSQPQQTLPSGGAPPCLPANYSGLENEWWTAGAKGVEAFYDQAAAAWRNYLELNGHACAEIGIWQYNPARDRLPERYSCVGVSSAPHDDYTRDEVKAARELCQKVPNDSNEVVWIGHEPGSALFAKKQLQSARYIALLPIYNQFNSHQRRFIVQIALTENSLDKGLLENMGAVFLRAADVNISERAAFAASRINYLLDKLKLKTTRELTESLAHSIQELIHCRGVSIFMKTPENRLRCSASTGIKWNRPTLTKQQEYYANGQGFPGYVMKHRQPLLVWQPKNNRNVLEIRDAWRSEEDDGKENPDPGCLIAPLFGVDNNVIGVLRCRTRIVDGKAREFCDDDLAIMDAILRAAAPDISVVTEDERRQKAYHRMIHEIRQPAVTIANAAQRTQRELAGRYALTQKWLADVVFQAGVIFNLVDDFSLTATQDRPVIENLEETYLFGHVIAPSARVIETPLSDKSISFRAVDYGKKDTWDVPPALYVDRARMAQVFMNLFTNSVKYCRADPRQFRIRVRGEVAKGGWNIHFDDNGIGIPEGWEEEIFLEGIRAPNAAKSNIQGFGIGLGVIRRVIEAHLGTVKVTSVPDPDQFSTRFTIWLPSILVRPNWYEPYQRPNK